MSASFIQLSLEDHNFILFRNLYNVKENKIEKAVEVLEIKEPTEIRSENGVLLVKTGCFLNARKEEISMMTAWYGQADKESEKEETLIEKITPLIRYYKGELQEYKEGYER